MLAQVINFRFAPVGDIVSQTGLKNHYENQTVQTSGCADIKVHRQEKRS